MKKLAVFITALLISSPAFAGLSTEDSVKFKQIATPSNPPAGYNKMYVKSDNLFYSLTPAGVEAVVGGSPYDQSLNTTNAVTFTTVNTGQGANELYDMDQNVDTTATPTFSTLTVAAEAYDATNWDADNTVPTKNDVRDKIEALSIVSPFTTAANLTYLTTTTDNLAVGGSTNLGKVTVDGDTDEVQLIVQGNATQTTNPFVVEKSDGTDLFSVSNTGTITSGGSGTEALTLGSGAQATYVVTANVSGTDTTQTFGSAVSTFSHGLTATGKLIADGSADIKNGATSSGVLAIFEDSDSGTNKATFQVPALAGDTVYTLPSDDGDAGEQLQTNGTGTLSWEAAGSGSASFEMNLLPQGAVLDDSSFPAINVNESTGTGTPRFYTADFDATTDEIIYWTFTVPSNMAAGDWLLLVSWYTNDTGANEDAIWATQLAAITEADTDTPLEHAASTYNSASENCNATEANRLIQTTVTITNTDSVAAGDLVQLRFWRDADDSSGDADNDGLTSDAKVVSWRLKIPVS